jgi:hypothetical protein
MSYVRQLPEQKPFLSAPHPVPPALTHNVVALLSAAAHTSHVS